jgi:hypothetical protein
VINKKSFAIWGFVLGIVSFIPYLEWLSIPGIIFSSLGIKSERRILAVVGLVLSIASLLLALFFLLMLVSNIIGIKSLVPF